MNNLEYFFFLKINLKRFKNRKIHFSVFTLVWTMPNTNDNFLLLWLTYLKFIQIGGNCRGVILASQTDRQTKSFELTLRPQLVNSPSFGQLFIIILSTFRPNIPSQGEMKKVLPHLFKQNSAQILALAASSPNIIRFNNNPCPLLWGWKCSKPKQMLTTTFAQH